MARLTARAFNKHYSFEAHFFMVRDLSEISRGGGGGVETEGGSQLFEPQKKEGS